MIIRLLAAVAVAAATVNWILLWRADLVLSHYDAKAHLVVARRLFDNITPGWQQVGGIWLPLPHLLNAIPIQVDILYRTGAFASIVSIACMGVLTYAAARLVLLSTGSQTGAVVSAALLVLNPNLLYLHATPMTEPLFLAATFLALVWLVEWVRAGDERVPVRLGWVLFAAMWTRYEAWPVIAAAVLAALVASRRWSGPMVPRAWRLAVWPAAAVLLFLTISRVTTGAWFVAGGFYERDPIYDGQLVKSLLAVWWGTHRLSTRIVQLAGLAGIAALVVRVLRRHGSTADLIPVALTGVVLLPVYAFYVGHPFRMRYMIPAAAASALFSGVAVGLLRRPMSIALAAVLVAVSLLQAPPWQRDAPMLVEAQWDRPASEGRRRVTSCLTAGYRGEKILASMGSLAHYMQELSREGFAIAEFVHEGNGIIWNLAMQTGPSLHAGWMLVEEQAEGGDTLARRIRVDPAFARDMSRVCDGGGVALYRRYF